MRRSCSAHPLGKWLGTRGKVHVAAAAAEDEHIPAERVSRQRRLHEHG
jgi:hypothetical protein